MDFIFTEKLLYFIKNGAVTMLLAHIQVCKLGLLYVDENGNTPLLVAALQGNVKCMNAILKTGIANFKQINYFGQNALTLATYSGNLKCVKLLLTKWSYKDYNETSFTPPICVAAMSGHLDLVRYFSMLHKPEFRPITTCHCNLILFKLTVN